MMCCQAQHLLCGLWHQVCSWPWKQYAQQQCSGPRELSPFDTVSYQQHSCCAVLCCDKLEDEWQGLVQQQGEMVNGLLPPPHPLRAPRSIPSCPKLMLPVNRLPKVAVFKGRAHLATVQDSKAVRCKARISCNVVHSLSVRHCSAV